MELTYRTAVYSLGAQVVFGLLTLVGLFVGDDKEGDLTPIFALELGSQAIEFAWYAVTVVYFREIVTWTRYLDWFFSTPIMLVSTVLFFLHRSETRYSTFVHSARLPSIVAVNAFMLACGFAYELGATPRLASVAVGSVALGGSFALMATYVDFGDGLSVGLWLSMAVVWALYGVAALLPYTEKNVGYNMLDIVSKNFYGVFLTVYSIA